MVTGTRRSAREVTSTALVSNNNSNNNNNAVASTSSSTSSAVSVQPNKVTTKNVPAFLNKLYLMVDDPKSNELIKWSEDGESFCVPFEQRFGKEMLPRYFKHSNFGSFVRQLNMYGFHKVPHIQQGVLHTESATANELLEFANANFIRGQPDLLHLIRRQQARSDAPAHRDEKVLDLPSLLTDLSAIRKHQSALSSDLKELQTSNNGLWQEAISSRERHTRQQDTIDKILRFLATVFGGQAVGSDLNNQSPGNSSVVVEDEPTPNSTDGNEKGKGKETTRATPKRKAQLFLTDVPRLAGEEEEEIEEIPQARHDTLPSFSSTSQYGNLPPMARSTSYSNYIPTSVTSTSRFTDVPSPNPNLNLSNTPTSTAYPTDFPVIPPDILSSLLASGNGDALTAYLNNNSTQNTNYNNLTSTSTNSSNSLAGMTLPSLPSFAPTPDFTRSLLPSPGPSTLLQNVPNALASLIPTINSLSPFGTGAEDLELNQALMENNQVLNDVLIQKEDIDQRTTALEEAIKNLMDTLPVETRNQLENSSGLSGGYDFGTGSNTGLAGVGGSGNSVNGDSGMGWTNNDDFLAEFINNENMGNSSGLSPNPLSAPPTFSPADYSFLDLPKSLNNAIPPLPLNVGKLGVGSSSTDMIDGNDRSVSPSDSVLWRGQNSTSSERSWDDNFIEEEAEEAELEEEEEDDDYNDKKSTTSSKKGKLKKRKSDALGSGAAGEKKKKSKV